MTDRCGWILMATLLLGGRPLAAGISWGEGRVSLGWRLLSDAGSLSADAQDLSSHLRLRSEAIGDRQLRLVIDADTRHSVASRHLTGPDGPLYTDFDERLRLRRFGLEVDAGGGRLRLGRHLPGLRVIGAGDTDGASWSCERGAWRAALAAGTRVAFWEADVGPGTGPAQWGGELGWRPLARWTVSAGLWRDEAVGGQNRLRLGVNTQMAPRPSLDLRAHAEADPGDGWLLWRATGGWRGDSGVWRLHADVGGQRLPLFPVAGRVDSSLYGGRSHSLGLSLQRQWGRSLALHLRLRSRYGARPQRTESAGLRWTGPWPGVGLTLRVTDSWSRWRQLERLDLVLTSRWRRRWHLSTGASASAFQWRTAREPTWRTRLRPHVGVRHHAAAGWTLDLRLEETMDEFLHLRTQARAGLSHRL